MKKRNNLILIIYTVFFSLIILSICSCSSSINYSKNESMGIYNPVEGEEYNNIKENPFIKTNVNNKSFFSMDSNTASYANLRRYINNGNSISGDIIKTDELINYFSYNLPNPNEGEILSVSAEMAKAPWNDEHQLLTIGLASKVTELSPNIRNNIVFLIDVSGSMMYENKITLIKKAFSLFIEAIDPSDKVSIVTYASGVKTVANGEYARNKDKLINLVNGLKAGGSTAGGGGLQLAYKVAKANFITDGNNRVIMCSDGDFNVGISTQSEIQEYISGNLDSGIYLSTLGFGMGNYHDTTMETLARYGNGIYAYIDDIREAKKVLVDELKTTLITVAKDVKTQVAFNPLFVESYRLIGYENKQISEDEFNDDTKDAGELGSNHTTMIAYELVLTDEVQDSESELFRVQVNYKEPANDENLTIAKMFKKGGLKEEVSDDYLFVSCLVEFSLILRDSQYKGQASLSEMYNRLTEIPSTNLNEYRNEFANLVAEVIRKELVQ